MQADANILIIGIISHTNESGLVALQTEFKLVFTMSQDSDKATSDRIHHLEHTMNRKGGLALVDHLNEQGPTIKFDFICLEYVRMPSVYYRNFVTGSNFAKPGTPLRDFVVSLRQCKKLNSGCKLLVASIEKDDDGHRWSQTIQVLQQEFGDIRYVDAKENPLYRACEKSSAYHAGYDHVHELQLCTTSKKPFAEFTVGPPLNLSDLPSGDDDPESFDFQTPTLGTLVAPPTKNDDTLSPSGDGDQESDFDFQTLTLGTLVTPPTENDDALSPSADGDQESDYDFQTPTFQIPTLATLAAPPTENDDALSSPSNLSAHM